ncbi:MAG TPA: hypothetical protein PLM72_07420, partial [Spirochaetota bacterium]|nr:hypothetical protein [Spirochaetota bacterium]
MGSKTGTKIWTEVAMSTLYRAITSGSVYATERAAILADPSTILFGKAADGGYGLRLGAKVEKIPEGEIMFDGSPEYIHKVDFTAVGFDTPSDAVDRAALWAKAGVKQYFYFMSEDTQEIVVVGLMMPKIAMTREGGTVEVFKITAEDQASATNVYLEKQYGTGKSVPAISITSPNGAEVYGQGDTVAITWNANFTDAVKIELFKGDSLNLTINSGIGAMAGTYNWVIAADQAIGTDYSIKISRVS